MNFFVGNQSYIGNIASAVPPRVWSWAARTCGRTTSLCRARCTRSTRQFYGKMPLFGQVESVCYSEPHMTSGYKTKYWTMHGTVQLRA